MSLRDEHYPQADGCHCGWKPDLVQGAQTWQQWRSHLNNVIERALADERAATIEECKSALRVPLGNLPGTWRCVSAILDSLPRDRHALDDMLTKAEEIGWSKAVSETIQHFSTGPQAGCGCAYCDPRTRYGDVLAQARREQKEKDAIRLENIASAILSGTVGKALEQPILIAHLLREVTATIRAQED